MSKDDYIKLPRLYVDQELKENAVICFQSDQAHYLKHVMRRIIGDSVRVFNGRDGEWRGVLESFEKKSATACVTEHVKIQPSVSRSVHLIFAPIKKARMDFLIEKSVELGVTHLHPVLTQHTEVRNVNEQRLTAQIIEAAEQCERLDIPVLYSAQTLENLWKNWSESIKIYACLERGDNPVIKDIVPDLENIAFLIGPEGGFSESECDYLYHSRYIYPVSLGSHILRSETAALAALAQILRQ